MEIVGDCRDCGGFYCPRLDDRRLIVQALQTTAMQTVQVFLPENGDWQRAFNTLMTLTGFLLANVMGLRMAELRALWRGEIDLYAGTLGVLGKRDRLQVRNRILVIPVSMRGLLAHGLSVSSAILQERRLKVEDDMPFLWVFNGKGTLRPMVAKDLRSCVAKAVSGSRLEGKLPRWHSGRYALQTYLTERGLSFDETNYILGHQVTGLGATNPLVRFDWAGMEVRYLKLAEELLEEIGYEPGLFTCTKGHQAADGFSKADGEGTGLAQNPIAATAPVSQGTVAGG